MRLNTSEDAEHVRAFAANFFFWQGLRWIPFGLALIATAAALAGYWPLPAAIGELFPLLAMVAALVISGLIDVFYRHNYGQTTARPHLFARRGRIKWGFVYPLIIGALLIDGLIRPPVLLSSFALAIALLAYVGSTGGGRNHYVVAGLGLAALGAATAFGRLPAGIEGLNLLLALTGAIFVVGGVLDHLEMRRRLAKRTGEE